VFLIPVGMVPETIIHASCGGEYMNVSEVYTWKPSMKVKVVSFAVEVSMVLLRERLYEKIGVDVNDIELKISYQLLDYFGKGFLTIVDPVPIVDDASLSVYHMLYGREGRGRRNVLHVELIKRGNRF
jgi:hypothetical protein